MDKRPNNYDRDYNSNYDRNYTKNLDKNRKSNKSSTFSQVKTNGDKKYIGRGENSSYNVKNKNVNKPNNKPQSANQYQEEQYYQNGAISVPNKSTDKQIKAKENSKKVAKNIAKIKRTMPVDFTLLFASLTLMLFGIVMIFSASYYTTMTSALYGYDMFYFLKRQTIWVILGIIAMFFCMNFPYVAWKKFANIVYIISITCQLLLFTPLGIKINGQTRWLGFGETFSFQPSELTKIGVIIFLSHYLALHRKKIVDLPTFAVPVGFLLVPVILIVVSNFSSAILIFLMGATIIFVASPQIKYFIYAGIAAIPLAGIAVSMFSYRITRITTWLDPWSDPLGDGFQTIQGLYAVASGGFFGLGLGQSRQKTFVPESHNDIIFAIICEELGIIGAAFVIILFVVLIYRGIKIAINAKENFGMLMATGITAVIAFQAIINIGVVTNTIPNTGQPLPFISYGGTSLLFLSAMIGILLNISKYQRS